MDLEEETTSIEKELNPKTGLMKDSTAITLLRLEARIKYALGCFRWIDSAMAEVDEGTGPEEEPMKDAHTIVDRAKAIPGHLQSWKKSAARAGEDIALSLI